MRAPVVLLALVFLLPASAGVAQVTATEAMPAGWETLSAREFLTAAQRVITEAGANLTGSESLGNHAWERFLGNPQFIAQGDWPTVLAMVESFGGTDSEGVATLRTRIKERLSADSSIIRGEGIYELGNTTRSLQGIGFDEVDRAQVYADWMAENDWNSRGLELKDYHNLYGWVSADAVDWRHFSARWTGTITAPRTGEYTIRQIQQYSGTDCLLTVTIGGSEILDSRDKKASPERFESKPIQLTAGEPLPIVVEAIQDVSRIDYSEGAPMIVLTWESAGIPEQIIPSSAYSPAGADEASPSGLTGEYFRDISFGELQLTRIDPALDLVWSWAPVAPYHDEEAADVLEECKKLLLDGGYLSAAVDRHDSEVFSYVLWRVAYHMSASEREQLVRNLLDNPKVLSFLTPQMMGRLYQAIYFLPGGEQVELLGEWSLARPQPRCQAGVYPGWSDGSFQKINTDFYWLAGIFLQGPYEEYAESLAADYLVLPNGECNLTVAYILSFAARENEAPDELFAMIQEQLDDNQLSGDQMMTWYLAKAYTLETFRGKDQKLMAGIKDLQAAHVVAQGKEHRYWALQELTARLIPFGSSEKVKELVSRYQSDFGTERGIEMARWSTMADELAQGLKDRQEQKIEEREAAIIAEFKRRRQAMIDKGDEKEIDRYSEIIQQAEARGQLGR